MVEAPAPLDQTTDPPPARDVEAGQAVDADRRVPRGTAGHRVDGRAQHRARGHRPADLGQPDPIDLDRGQLHPGAGVPAAAGRGHRRPVRPARRTACSGWSSSPLASFAPTVRSDPTTLILARAAAGVGCGFRHARHAVPADVGVPEGRAQPRPSESGPVSPGPARSSECWEPVPLLHLLVVAVDLLGASSSRPPRSSRSP